MVALVLLAVGCASTEVTQLSRNEVLISTSAAPACRETGAQRVAARMAAVQTLRSGFDRYIIVGVGNRSNVRPVALPPTGSTTVGQVTATGNTAYGTSNTTYHGGGVVLAGRHSAYLHVVMLNPDDAGYDEGVDARSVLGENWRRYVEDGIPTCSGGSE